MEGYGLAENIRIMQTNWKNELQEIRKQWYLKNYKAAKNNLRRKLESKERHYYVVTDMESFVDWYKRKALEKISLEPG